jgi:hypothetical protein
VLLRRKPRGERQPPASTVDRRHYDILADRASRRSLPSGGGRVGCARLQE